MALIDRQGNSNGRNIGLGPSVVAAMSRRCTLEGAHGGLIKASLSTLGFGMDRIAFGPNSKPILSSTCKKGTPRLKETLITS